MPSRSSPNSRIPVSGYLSRVRKKKVGGTQWNSYPELVRKRTHKGDDYKYHCPGCGLSTNRGELYIEKICLNMGRWTATMHLLVEGWAPIRVIRKSKDTEGREWHIHYILGCPECGTNIHIQGMSLDRDTIDTFVLHKTFVDKQSVK